MDYANPTKNRKHVNVWARFHICDCVCDNQMLQNGSLHVVIGVNQTNCTKKWKTCNVWAWFYMYDCVWQNEWLNPEFWIQPSDLSVQSGFPKVRRWEGCQKQIDIAFGCCIYGISDLGIAGTHSQLCIANYKYRKKTIIWIGLLIRHAHTHIWQIFISKRHLPEWNHGIKMLIIQNYHN